MKGSTSVGRTGTDMSVELIKNAEAGRGLWIGMYPEILESPSQILAFLPKEPHITLCHLGKKNDMDRVCAAMRAVAWGQSQVRFRAEITGAGCFWHGPTRKTYVALVNSPILCSLREKLLLGLKNEGVTFDDRYGFIPHISLDQEAVLDQPRASLMLGPSISIEFRRIVVVCGDERVQP